jgi:hypothetical protein
LKPGSRCPLIASIVAGIVDDDKGSAQHTGQSMQTQLSESFFQDQPAGTL